MMSLLENRDVTAEPATASVKFDGRVTCAGATLNRSAAKGALLLLLSDS